MDALKQQLLKVQQQLAGLNSSQKMLTASLLVIMVMTLFYWSRFASSSEMEAVIDKPLSAEELANVKSAVAQENVPYEIRDSRVYVPASKQAQVKQAMSNLALNGKLPASYAQAAPEDDKGTFFDSPNDRSQRRQDARSRRVEGIIRGWEGVTNATVILTGAKRGGLLDPEKPTAGVSIDFAGNRREAKKYVDAARLLVSHMQPGMSADDVAITVNGQAYGVEDDAFGGEGILAKRKEAEKHFVDNVRGRLNYINGLMVSVSVKLDTNTSVSTEHQVNPKDKVEIYTQQSSNTEENTQPVTGGEPGSTANTGVMDAPTVTAGRNSNIDKSESKNQYDVGYKNVNTTSPAGNSSAQAASIGVPESYYRRVWKYRNPKSTSEPTLVDLQPLIKDEEKNIRESVKNTLLIGEDRAVSVATYFDIEQASPDNATASLAALPAGSGFGVKEIAVGALAVISLFMVSMMVRKSAPQPVMVAAAPPAPVADAGPGLLTIRDLAGEVAEADLTMTGQELSEEAIEARQVIEQVGTMVKQNPDVAANLVKRWLNQD